jgi:hypothetical protein
MHVYGDEAIFLLALRRSKAAGDGLAEAAIEVLRVCSGQPPGALLSSGGEIKSPLPLTNAPRGEIFSSWDAISTD